MRRDRRDRGQPAGLAYAGAHAITRVELDVFVRNTHAIAFYETCGFVIAGRRSKRILMDGDYLDDLHMARVTVPLSLSKEAPGA